MVRSVAVLLVVAKERPVADAVVYLVEKEERVEVRVAESASASAAEVARLEVAERVVQDAEEKEVAVEREVVAERITCILNLVAKDVEAEAEEEEVAEAEVAAEAEEEEVAAEAEVAVAVVAEDVKLI